MTVARDVHGGREEAIIYKTKEGTYGIDFPGCEPTVPVDAKIIDKMQRKDGETESAFRERVVRYLEEEVD